jgi:hypothetical protein
LATWFAGTLKPTEEPHELTNPGMPEGLEDENRIGLTGEGRATFIKTTIDGCNQRSSSAHPIDCSCFANAMADSVSIKELKEISAAEGMTALRPKMEAATKRCLTN